MTNPTDTGNDAEQPTSVVQGSLEPEINKHAHKRRSQLIYKILAFMVVVVVLGYVGLKLYGIYKDVAGEKAPTAKPPESTSTASKRRMDLGKNTQFFEKEPVTTAAGEMGNLDADSGPPSPVADLGFKKYLSIPVQDGSGSISSTTTSQADSSSSQEGEPQTAGTGAQASAGGQKDGAVTGMKVESIAMDPNLYVEENTYIPCTLQTRFVSDVAGRISCTISEDVYSANSRVKLIEKGTKAFGVYRTGTLKQGQGRMFVVWTQLRTRDFKKISLVDTQVVGQLGESGIDGWVDEHFWDRFKGALMLSTVQDLATALAKRNGNQSNNSDYTQNTRESTSQMANTALENSINIPPTMYKNQGDVIGILVGEDIDFSGVYAVRLKK